jgi:hypothetical protein
MMKSTRLRSCVYACGIALASLMAGSARADCGSTPPGGYCAGVRVTLLYIDANSNAYLTVAGNMAALPCTLDDGLIRVLGASVNFKPVVCNALGRAPVGSARERAFAPQREHVQRCVHDDAMKIQPTTSHALAARGDLLCLLATRHGLASASQVALA